jgi:hypothetical protein
VKTWLVALIVGLVGVVLLSAVTAAVAGGRDHTGDTVSAHVWANDVCGATGAWEGQVEGIGNEVKLSNVGARRIDGSGDTAEGTIYVRGALLRIIGATRQTLQDGLKRAGTPDAPQGQQASLILRNWAQQTQNDLQTVDKRLKQKPNTTSAAFASLGATVAVLERSALAGRAAYKQVAGLDSALADALNGARNCRDLMKEQP